MRSSVLLLVFNRPGTTRQVFDAIRSARPPKLYIAADGPRTGRAGEAERCAEVRAIVTAVDWPCEVKTLFRENNLGCKIGVSSGISWFFSQEDEGIILEDDVLPVASFFIFCDELLNRYRNDDRVAMISGCNLISNCYTPGNSYFFSRYNHIWGWATWRRAWQNYDVEMKNWPTWRDGPDFRKVSAGNRLFRAHWRGIFNAVYDGKVDTWDYQWTFAMWRMRGLAVLPAVNQTSNLGFGIGATHTTATAPEYVIASRPRLMDWPLKHPDDVRRDNQADRLIDSKVFSISQLSSMRRRFGRLRVLVEKALERRTRLVD